MGIAVLTSLWYAVKNTRYWSFGISIPHSLFEEKHFVGKKQISFSEIKKEVFL